MTLKINLGIIGTGRMGKKRAKALNKLDYVSIKWICSRNKKTGIKFAKEHDIKEVIINWENGFQDKKIDGVIITAPNHLHDTLAINALKNNLHVLLEYPMALTVKKSKNIINTAKNSSGILHIGLTHRLDNKHQTIKQELNNLSPIRFCNIIQCSGKKISRWFDDKNKVGNVIIGSNYHYIDQILDWFGPLKWVNADIYEEPMKKDEKKIKKDIGSVMLKFKNDITAYITYARGWPEPGLGYNCKIIGEDGYLVENNEQLEKWSVSGKKKLEYTNNDSTLEDTKLFINKIQDNSHNSPYSVKDGLYGVKVAELACKSVEEGKRKYINSFELS